MDCLYKFIFLFGLIQTILRFTSSYILQLGLIQNKSCSTNLCPMCLGPIQNNPKFTFPNNSRKRQYFSNYFAYIQFCRFLWFLQRDFFILAHGTKILGRSHKHFSYSSTTPKYLDVLTNKIYISLRCNRYLDELSINLHISPNCKKHLLRQTTIYIRLRYRLRKNMTACERTLY